ncbi:uncharacterized protein A1O9_00871 [Exophiala aquamarina CBS 119918]|uniref:Cytochrome P450 oxidoreductase n=1 Tax=Exophiala aquamarina CBS 119918 TaxID=1182545 RepID=A0A072PT31_9EURO|nr:uncharacterized protein A1O9_00871 [Exophiala aquamarina CBS 119918]KEF62897.1 hypothetical protein A1O9_00871 [Exophiala aquamarina CBS 119918]
MGVLRTLRGCEKNAHQDQAIQRLLFHRLRHIPGPFFAKLSSNYLSWATFKARRAYKLLELHEQYGPIVRVGPNEVSISNWRAYRDIYSDRTVTKDPSFYEALRFLGLGNVFAEINPSVHSSRRKVMSSVFSHSQLIKNEDLILERVNVLLDRALDQVATSPTGTADLFDLCGTFSLEVICRLSFNCTFSKDSDLSHRLLKALEGSTIALLLAPQLPQLLQNTKYRGKIPGALGKSFRCFDVWEGITRDMLVQFQNQSIDSEKRATFLAAPLVDDKPKHIQRQYTLEEAVEEAMGIAIAGTGVTEHTMVYFLYQLSRPENKSMQMRLRKEVSIVGTTYADYVNLPYLSACIKETFRVHPVIMSTLPRILHDKLVVTQSGTTIPPGTLIGMQNYVHHRDSELFPQPAKFVPERWLEDGSCDLTTDLKDMNSALTPFSVGARNCLGQSLGKIELWLALGTIFRRVELRLNASMTEDDMRMLDRWAMFPKGGKLLLDVTPLKAAESEG